MRSGSLTVELYVRARYIREILCQDYFIWESDVSPLHSRMLATSLRLRGGLCHLRHKLLLLLALVVLLCWFNLGSLKSGSDGGGDEGNNSNVVKAIEKFKSDLGQRKREEGGRRDPTIPKALRAKEYPDFDYRCAHKPN